jgi:hypothetical protein
LQANLLQSDEISVLNSLICRKTLKSIKILLLEEVIMVFSMLTRYLTNI